MSGDRLDIFGKSYYFDNNTSNDNYNVPVLDPDLEPVIITAPAPRRKKQ